MIVCQHKKATISKGVVVTTPLLRLQGRMSAVILLRLTGITVMTNTGNLGYQRFTVSILGP